MNLNVNPVITFFELYFYFSICGAGLSLLLITWGSRGRYSSLCFLPILGISQNLILASILFRYGFSNSVVVYSSISISMFGFLLIVFLQRGKLGNISMKYIETKFKCSYLQNLVLNIVLILLSVLPMLFLNKNTLMNIRLGIDGALYADGAQSLILQENKPELENISGIRPGSLATALFFQHFRWGTAFLLSISAHVTNAPHTFEVAVPFFCLVLFLTGSLFLKFLIAEGINNPKLQLLGITLIASNVVLLNLVLEAQWANLLAVLFNLLVVFFIRELFLQNSFGGQIVVVFMISIGIISTLVNYAEVIPLLLVITVITFIGSLYRFKELKKSILVRTHLIIVWAIAIFFFYSLKSGHLTYLRSLFLPSYAGVGYPTPRSILPSDIIGITNPWANPDSWLSPIESVARSQNSVGIVLFVTNLAIIIFIMYVSKKCLVSMFSKNNGNLIIKKSRKSSNSITEKQRNVHLVAFVSLSLFIWINARILNGSDYLLLKAVSIVLPIVLIEILVYTSQHTFARKRMKEKFANIAMAAITISVCINGFKYVNQFYDSSQRLQIGFIDSPKFEGDSNCLALFNLRGYPESKLRYVDRSLDYYLDVIFRDKEVLDPWGGGFITRPLIDDISDKRVCLYLRKSVGERFDRQGLKVLFENRFWIVLDTNMTHRQVMDRYGVPEYYLIELQR